MPLPRTFEELGARQARRDESIRASAERDASIQRAEDTRQETLNQLAQERSVNAVAALSNPFNPSEILTAQILEDIASDQMSLAAVASRCKTSLAALTSWMTSPPISPQLAALEQAIAIKQRLTAISSVTDSMNACSRMFMEYHHAESHLDFDSSNLQAQKTRCRIRENALEASRVLIQLNKLFAVDVLCQSRAVGGVGGAQAAGAASTTTSTAPTTPAPPTSNLSDLKSQICDPPAPAPIAHPDAHRIPATKRERDPLTPNHPAILSGAAPASSLDPISLDPSIPSPRCPSCITCPAACPSKPTPTTHPP